MVSVPYKCTPSRIIKANPEDKVYWRNIFTPKYYILQATRPAGMILGEYKPNYPNLKLDFVQYG